MKFHVFVALALIAFFVVGVVAEQTDLINVDGLTNETKVYIEKFLENDAIQANEITAIQPVDLQNPPADVEVKNVEDTNIAIYQVNYTQGSEEKKIYVVSYATPDFVNPADIQGTPTIEYLHFGENALSNGSIYLKTSEGVRSSADQGYVMMDSGSITGLSTNIKFVGSSGEELTVSIYKNGEFTGIRNTFDAQEGVSKDYDTQSEGIVNFVPGDVISVSVESSADVNWDDVITMVKLELN
jgi:hypothetical protein